MHKKTFSPMLLLSAALAFAALPPRAEGELDEATKARNLQNLLDKNKGDAVALAAVLLAENNEARETIRTQKAELAKVQVPEGSVVLTKEQAAQWTEYQALGAPAEVKTKIETGAAAAEKLTGFEKKETLRSVAERVGYKPSVLEKLGGDLTRLALTAGGPLDHPVIFAVQGGPIYTYTAGETHWRDAYGNDPDAAPPPPDTGVY
ncbi:hypothetical protein MF271_04990 [Deinococcus sp. KNUC1210]|uniref:hypothetical protein n=1 Tax=Deinococcus sp. KNUC1210 TaxID=2917691 RepID=UPI001EEFF511|nr:hypothetical protein [Deinococcus sp. KNUC1210]ULH15991.1 hypothetical protein MF271_04990 [Deinococcus sp. KNUC1210]